MPAEFLSDPDVRQMSLSCLRCYYIFGAWRALAQAEKEELSVLKRPLIETARSFALRAATVCTCGLNLPWEELDYK